jgi:integrase
VGRKSINGGVSAKGNRIQFDFEFEGVRYRPTIESTPTPANLMRARKRLEDIKKRIDQGRFNFEEEFPDFRFIEKVVRTTGPLTCDEIFNAFLKHCEARVARRDLAFVTYNGYRKLLAQIWRPEIGDEIFRDVRYSRLAEIADGHTDWSKKTYNNAISTIRCAFDFGYRDHPEKPNPAKALTCLRIAKKDRRPVDPFTLDEAQALIAGLHTDWGDAIGNYDEFRFVTGLRPSEEIALLITDYDRDRRELHVTKARVLRRDKDRPKNGEERTIELCGRAIDVLERQLALHARYVAERRINHKHLFFHEDGAPIADPECTRWRWNETLNRTVDGRGRGPYHARHTFVSWNLMLGKPLLWVAQQAGHSVEVMLRMYAKWLQGATEADIEAIRRFMDGTQSGDHPKAVKTPTRVKGEPTAAVRRHRPAQSGQVIAFPKRPLRSPGFGTRLALDKANTDLSAGKDRENNWRRGWDSNPRAGITRPSDFESAPL